MGDGFVDDAFLAALVRTSPDPYVVVDREARVRFASGDIVTFLGRTAESLLGKSAFEMVAPHHRDAVAAAMAELIRTDELGIGWSGPPLLVDLVDVEGRLVPVEVLGLEADERAFDGVAVRLRPAKDTLALDRAIAAMATSDDLVEVLGLVLELLRTQLPASVGAIGLAWGEAGFDRVVGGRLETTVVGAAGRAGDGDGRPHRHAAPWPACFAHGKPIVVDDLSSLPLPLEDEGRRHGAVGCWCVPFRAEGSDDNVLVVWRQAPGPMAQHLADAVGRLVHLVQLAVTNHHSRLALLERARTDPLTGLANRHGLADRLQELERAATGVPMGLLYCDIDDFKPVNDVHGHGVGDRVLSIVAKRIAGVARAGDLVVRLGGDEFVVVCPGIDGDGLDRMCERLRRAFDEPIRIGEVVIALGVSVGAIVLDETWQERPLDVVLDQADRALMSAKAARRH
jgi:diguanylate cyclase (GGDEF)-like protein/PAS domain S-box-containing protein